MVFFILFMIDNLFHCLTGHLLNDLAGIDDGEGDDMLTPRLVKG